jgi:methylphosphotriester-DNA--protein-cysteine methyltransferase
MLPLPLHPITAPSQEWRALTTRTASPNLLPFYYGVLATKIYCRPTCSARLARRANVIYFSCPSAAVSAGYRACKRCRPNDDLFLGEAEEVVMKAMEVIGRSRGKREKQGLEGIAMQTGVSRSYLCRVFKKTMGMTVGEYIKEFEKEGEEFVDSISLDGESVMVQDEAKSSQPLHQCRKGVQDVYTEFIGDHTSPDMDAELGHGQYAYTGGLNNDSNDCQSKLGSMAGNNSLTAKRGINAEKINDK